MYMKNSKKNTHFKNDYTDNQKELLKNEIEFIINYIDFYNNLNKESKSKEEIQMIYSSNW